MIDVKHQISEVRREVGGKALGAGEARVASIAAGTRGAEALAAAERVAAFYTGAEPPPES